MKKKEFGKYGEDLAAAFLMEKGYKILARNVFTQFGEIDLVVYGKETYHFIEVKTRRKNSFGAAAESVSSAKLHHFLKAVNIYIHKNNLHEESLSVDLVAIDVGKKGQYSIEWIQNITI